jgi:hypothetical protein
MEKYRNVEVSFHALETSVLDGSGQQYSPRIWSPEKDPSVTVRITRGATAAVGLFSAVPAQHLLGKTA